MADLLVGQFQGRATDGEGLGAEQGGAVNPLPVGPHVMSSVT